LSTFVCCLRELQTFPRHWARVTYVKLSAMRSTSGVTSVVCRSANCILVVLTSWSSSWPVSMTTNIPLMDQVRPCARTTVYWNEFQNTVGRCRFIYRTCWKPETVLTHFENSNFTNFKKCKKSRILTVVKCCYQTFSGHSAHAHIRIEDLYVMHERDHLAIAKSFRFLRRRFGIETVLPTTIAYITDDSSVCAGSILHNAPRPVSCIMHECVASSISVRSWRCQWQRHDRTEIEVSYGQHI